MRAAISSATLGGVFANSTPNSSPPSRPTASPGRTAAAIVCTTQRSSSSPGGVPLAVVDLLEMVYVE